jgi:hypothetical protein
VVVVELLHWLSYMVGLAGGWDITHETRDIKLADEYGACMSSGGGGRKKLLLVVVVVVVVVML